MKGITKQKNEEERPMLNWKHKMTCYKPVPVICIFTIILCLCTSCNSVFHGASSESTTAILGAFDKEVVILEEQLSDKQEHKIEGIRFVTGKLKGRKVVIARTGIAKVNAAMTATLLIEHYKPTEVIFTGIAGGINPDVRIGDVVIAEKTAQHDLGVLTTAGFKNEGAKNPINGRINPVFFPADERLLNLAQQAAEKVKLEKIDKRGGGREPKILKGVIITGDVFAATTAARIGFQKRLGADAVEMEGAAVAQICYQRQIPYLVIRGISDNADENALEDVHKFLQIAANNAASLTAETVALLKPK